MEKLYEHFNKFDFIIETNLRFESGCQAGAFGEKKKRKKSCAR
jgi:hypothetical protein